MALHRFSMAYHRVHGHLTQKSIQNMFSPFSNMFGFIARKIKGYKVYSKPCSSIFKSHIKLHGQFDLDKWMTPNF